MCAVSVRVGKLFLWPAFATLCLAVAGAASAYEVFDNDRLRFGTGNEASVNAKGNLQQPFYYDAVLSGGGWFKLTYSNYPLNNAIGIDGDGSNDWNTNGTIVQDGTLAGQVIDVSGFTVTSGSKGYGTIVSTGTVTINAKTLEVQNSYSLPADKSFIEVTTTITNTSGGPVGNVRLWVGTQDDWIGLSDDPTKQRGNITDGAFAVLTNAADPSAALKIYSGDTGVLFYSTSPKANTAIEDCCNFANAYGQDPATSAIQATGDGSYALFVRMEDLADGESESFTWYYAAGELADLDDIIGDVAAASATSFADIAEDPASNAGETVIDVFGDPIAVTVVDNTNGTWQYSADGNAWSVFSGTTGGSADICGAARLLATGYYARFVPNANWNGATSLTFRTWDGTTGTAGSTADACTGGGAFSDGTADATLTVTAVNDAPTFSAGGTLAAVDQDTTAPAGATITSLLAANIGDVDGDGLAGIAVAADAANAVAEGAWQYSTDNGANWFAVGGTAVSTSAALLLGATTKLRFVPVTDYSGTPGALQVHAVDDSSATTFSSGATRQVFDTTADDATSRVAAAGVTLGTSITPTVRTVTVTAGAGGIVSPSGAQQVTFGESLAIAVTPDGATPYVTAGGTCPAGSWNGDRSQYTTGAITSTCTVGFSFFTLIAATDGGGNALTNTTTSPDTEQVLSIDAPGSVSVTSSVTRAGATTPLDVGGIAGVLTDLGGGNYTFRAADAGEYAFTFTDAASGQQVSVSFTVHAPVAFGSIRQFGTAGQSVGVRIQLADTPVAYPVTIPYTVQGAGLSGDLEPSGSVTIAAPWLSATLAVTPNAGVGSIVLKLADAGLTNAALGGVTEHTIVLREAVEVPLDVALPVGQGASLDTLVTRDGGNVVLAAVPLGGGSFTYDWSRSDVDLGIHTLTDGTVVVDPTSLDGSYHVEVVVTETVSPYRRATLAVDLRVAAAAPAGYGDFYDAAYDQSPQRLPICPDGAGVSACVAGGTGPVYVEAPRGHIVRLGQLSERASWARGDWGLAVNTDDIVDANGLRAGNADDPGFTHLGYRVDFELSGLDAPGSSVPVVVPLPAGEVIPANAVWRKYEEAQGWHAFRVDAGNALHSAPLNDAGGCPGPLSAGWSAGLVTGHGCVRLTLQDGGPNDRDGHADGVIRDPGSLAVSTTGNSGFGGGGGGALGGWSLAGLIALALARRRIRAGRRCVRGLRVQ